MRAKASICSVFVLVAAAAAAQVPAGGEFTVNTYTTGGQQLPRVALDGRGEFLIATSG